MQIESMASITKGFGFSGLALLLLMLLTSLIGLNLPNAFTYTGIVFIILALSMASILIRIIHQEFLEMHLQNIEVEEETF